MTAVLPVSYPARWRIFTDFAAFLAAYEALAAALPGSGEPLLPVRVPYAAGAVTARAHPTRLEWALAYDRISETLLAPAGLVDTLPADWNAARTHRDVFLAIWGQSNALGSNNSPAATAPWTDDRFGLRWRYWAEDGGSYFAGQGTPSASGTVGGGPVPMTTFTAGATRFSPGLALARYLKVGGFDVSSCLIGQGSTNLFSAWNASSPGAANLYQVALGETQAAITQAIAAGHIDGSRYRLVILWAQGEADASGELQSSAYEANLLDLFDTASADLAAHDPAMLVTQLNNASTRTFKDTVRAAQAAAAAARADMLLVDPGSEPLGVGDGLHYTPANHQRIMRIAAGQLAGQLTA